MSGVLQDYVTALAAALDDVEIHPASGGTPSSVTIPAFVDTTPAPPTGAGPASNRRADGLYLYNLTTYDQRRARPGGLDPATGIVMYDPPTTTAASAGQQVAMTRLFPFAEGQTYGEVSYRQLVNGALRKILVPRRL